LNRFAFTIAKNATANIVRGGASAIIAIALPHFLTRALDHDRFAAWALMLQIAAYANYLDFGIQTAVARYLAQAIERGDNEQRDRLISTAFAMLAIAGAAALVVIGAVIWQLPHIFHAIPLNLLRDLRVGLAVMAASAALVLPMSTFTGVLIGLHRNEYPAMAIGGSRLLGALAVVATAHYTHSLAWIALCIGITNLMGGFIQFQIAKRLLPGLHVLLSQATTSMARDLAHYCSGLTVVSFAMLLVTGLDVTVVGYFHFGAVGYYALASTLISFFSGLNSSTFSAMMTPVAVLQARSENSRIGELVISTTRIGSYGSLALTLPVFIYGHALLRLWVGPLYAAQILPILEVLLCAQSIRLLGSSYGITLIATAQQKYGIAGSIIEGVTNLAFSVAGAIWLGPIGVAFGTLIAAVIGVVWFVFYTMPRAQQVPLSAPLFLRESVVRPLLCVSPLLVFVLFSHVQNPSGLRLLVLLLACTGSFALSLSFGQVVPSNFRQRLWLQLQPLWSGLSATGNGR
jgi:O-antigen/teichoic acid export membrane protein